MAYRESLGRSSAECSQQPLPPIVDFNISLSEDLSSYSEGIRSCQREVTLTMGVSFLQLSLKHLISAVTWKFDVILACHNGRQDLIYVPTAIDDLLT